MDVDAALPRLNLNQRLQHGALALAVAGALGTGLALDRPLGAAAAAARAWHVTAGLAALGAVIYHLLYLVVRSYVEGGGWAGFALRLGRDDLAAARAEARYVLGSAPQRPAADEYRVSQKALYWWVIAAVMLLGVTGLGLDFWSRLGTLSVLRHVAALHRGLALLVLASLGWHLYGVLTWEGRWWPEWSWINGVLDAGKAERKVPGAWRRHLHQIAAAAAAAGETPEQRDRARLSRERDEVQAELEQGNALALEERYVEAVLHYRRALELYPGYSQARYNMARVLSRMGERQLARETYRQFLEADPFHPLAEKAQEAIRELDKQEPRP